MVQLSQHLELKQTLTPQQILLSTLLQLPTLALEQRIKQELEINPVLEMLDDVEDQEEAELETDAEKEESESEEDSSAEETEEIDWDEYFQNDGYEAKQETDHSQEEIEFQNAYKPSLPESLLEQGLELNLSESEYLIFEELVWSMDDRGYLVVPLDYVAEKTEQPLGVVENVHRQLMHLEPVGVGARTLQECLLVQITMRHPDSIAYKIIRNHFEDFANKRYERIIKALDLTRDELMEAEEMIEHLNPKPGEGYLDTHTNYITPDFVVREQDGDFLVTLNDTFIPELRLSSRYIDLLSQQKQLDSEAKTFLKKKVESAKWFINSIQMRRITMMKVMHAIIEYQHDFFMHGKGQLRPMILKDIADRIGMDISTVSRVTNGKYVQCDWGTFELRYFFSEGIESDDGENISTRRIKERLRKIIENEDKKRPISDELLSKMLQNEGFPVARRTVAKYREQMKIPVARLRREV
ncbi:MAG: RNA polymerase factor sigma-54 [Candidatus Marinimicrobia bacterium]|nr:RNA polymerase factor sigma-54 [Candidatus Neomarinimicrobiota bacterium]MCF7840547.1 RNA polymerase factor sigma-54 [Candidatus Neomarinimicrobiota bacterium]